MEGRALRQQAPEPRPGARVLASQPAELELPGALLPAVVLVSREPQQPERVLAWRVRRQRELVRPVVALA